jgi:hypothetical protein
MKSCLVTSGRAATDQQQNIKQIEPEFVKIDEVYLNKKILQHKSMDNKKVKNFLNLIRDSRVSDGDSDVMIIIAPDGHINMQVVKNGNLLYGYHLMLDGSLYGPYEPSM